VRDFAPDVSACVRAVRSLAVREPEPREQPGGPHEREDAREDDDEAKNVRVKADCHGCFLPDSGPRSGEGAGEPSGARKK
jgi:hypothetical protein